jgi:hypothetical protein
MKGMWGLLFFLWAVPLALGVLLLARSADNKPLLKTKERTLFFDETKRTELRPWPLLQLAALAVLFFSAGVAQALILPNLSGFWFVLGPLLSGGAAVLLVALWLRSASAPAARQRPRNWRLLRDLRRYMAGELADRPRKPVP